MLNNKTSGAHLTHISNVHNRNPFQHLVKGYRLAFIGNASEYYKGLRLAKSARFFVLFQKYI